MEQDDIVFYQQLASILSGIGTIEGNSVIFDSGVYAQGMLLGTITGEYQSKFIGVKAREKFRQEQIAICRAEFDALPKEEDVAEVKTELLYKAGILKDDISNSVTCIGIRGYLHSGELHQGIEGFFRLGEMLQLNLAHLGRMKTLNTVDNVVYIVENPAIFQN